MNNSKHQPQNFISSIIDGNIKIKNITRDIEDKLTELEVELEITKDKTIGVIRTDSVDQDQLAKILGKLRDIGLLFLDSPAGWPPSEIFICFRSQGLISGHIRTITWQGPDKWIIGMK